MSYTVPPARLWTVVDLQQTAVRPVPAGPEVPFERDLARSAWYGHDPSRTEEFARRYRAELREPERAAALQHLRDLADRQPLTLLTAAKDPDLSQAAVLADLLGR